MEGYLSAFDAIHAAFSALILVTGALSYQLFGAILVAVITVRM